MVLTMIPEGDLVQPRGIRVDNPSCSSPAEGGSSNTNLKTVNLLCLDGQAQEWQGASRGKASKLNTIEGARVGRDEKARKA